MCASHLLECHIPQTSGGASACRASTRPSTPPTCQASLPRHTTQVPTKGNGPPGLRQAQKFADEIVQRVAGALESGLAELIVQFWPNLLTSLSLSFLSYKVGIKVPASQDYKEGSIKECIPDTGHRAAHKSHGEETDALINFLLSVTESPFILRMVTKLAL